MSKKNLEARVKAYDRMLAGGTVQGKRVQAVDSKAFHKPGSNKK